MSKAPKSKDSQALRMSIPSPLLEARLHPYVARGRRGQRRDEGAGEPAARRAGGNRGGIGGGVPERRRQRPEDAGALGLQEFGDEGQGEIGLAAGNACGGGNSTRLAHRL